jgi:hypothetical protein
MKTLSKTTLVLGLIVLGGMFAGGNAAGVENGGEENPVSHPAPSSREEEIKKSFQARRDAFRHRIENEHANKEAFFRAHLPRGFHEAKRAMDDEIAALEGELERNLNETRHMGRHVSRFAHHDTDMEAYENEQAPSIEDLNGMGE